MEQHCLAQDTQQYMLRVRTYPGESWNLKVTFSRPLESHGIGSDLGPGRWWKCDIFGLTYFDDLSKWVLDSEECWSHSVFTQLNLWTSTTGILDTQWQCSTMCPEGSVGRVKTRNSAIAGKPCDAFRGQSGSANRVPCHMLGMVSYWCAIVTFP